MDVRIGLIQTARELEIELADDTDINTLKADVAQVLSDDDHVLWLTDRKGNQHAVAGGKVAYVTIGVAGDKGRIGFGG